jgi:hypothetical protein
MINETSFQINSICSNKAGLQGYMTLYMATQDVTPPAKSIKAFDLSTLYIGIPHLTCSLPWGRFGRFQNSTFDCQASAVASNNNNNNFY